MTRTKGGGREGSAAANLAACMIGGPSCTQTRHDERIRALDAELAALEKGAVEGSWRFRAEAAEARVKELMELVEIAATYVKTPIDKEQILDMLRNPNWREEWERKDAELREEDRG